jgi:hypothetical protein
MITIRVYEVYVFGKKQIVETNKSIYLAHHHIVQQKRFACERMSALRPLQLKLPNPPPLVTIPIKPLITPRCATHGASLAQHQGSSLS